MVGGPFLGTSGNPLTMAGGQPKSGDHSWRIWQLSLEVSQSLAVVDVGLLVSDGTLVVSIVHWPFEDNMMGYTFNFIYYTLLYIF